MNRKVKAFSKNGTMLAADFQPPCRYPNKKQAADNYPHNIPHPRLKAENGKKQGGASRCIHRSDMIQNFELFRKGLYHPENMKNKLIASVNNRSKY
ncbi:MAG: hypothetical protein V2B19_12495 [Pseudomonadota bacterium]